MLSAAHSAAIASSGRRVANRALAPAAKLATERAAPKTPQAADTAAHEDETSQGKMVADPIYIHTHK